MTKPFITLSIIFVAFIAMSSVSMLSAQNASRNNWPAIEKAYAQANLALADARLKLAQDQKSAVADSVPVDTMDALQSAVDGARARVEQLQKPGTAKPISLEIAAAERDVKACQTDYNKSLEANKLVAGAVPELQVELQAAELGVAKARLAAARALQNQPADVRMQWQINQLQDQIRALWARPLIED
jgi:hypothetical protein